MAAVDRGSSAAAAPEPSPTNAARSVEAKKLLDMFTAAKPIEPDAFVPEVGMPGGGDIQLQPGLYTYALIGPEVWPTESESQLSELEDEEAAVMREELGVGETGLDRVVRGAFGLLDLIAFFTAGEAKPAQSWHLRRGLTAWHAAGQIHSDIQRGFVRAEVIGWEALVEAGGYARARERGTLRLEGRDYVMADGDVITVKFTP